VFRCRIPLRYRDTDALGHVNYAVYLTYLEELLLRWLAPAIGEDFVAVHVELDFRQELRYGDGDVVACAFLDSLGRSSVSARFSIARPDGEDVLEGAVVVVARDPAVRRSRALTEEEKDAIRERAARELEPEPSG
jgi:acyl-CoA thioester hydrolase